jgi:thioredoxin 1
MASVELTAENFDSTITDNDIVVVDFWADWCGPCKAFAPTFEAASDQHPEITFGKVDTEAEQSLAGAAGIQSIPTLMVFREKVLLFSQAGALPPAALDDLLTQVKGLDMQAVHAEIAKQIEESQTTN